MFLSIGHMYGLLILWKMKIKQTENNIMLYFLQKQNYCRSTEKFRKIGNLHRRCFLKKYATKAFHQLILGKKTSACQKEILKLLLQN